MEETVNSTKSKKIKRIVLKIVLFVLFIAFSIVNLFVSHTFTGDATTIRFDFYNVIWFLIIITVLSLIFFIIALFRKKFRLLNVILSLILALSLFPSVLFTDSILSKQYQEFTPEKWSECDYHYRQYMIDDFENQYDIVGMKREDVQSLLGDTGYYDEENQAYYEIGTAGVFNNFYIVTYDDNGIVTDAVIEGR